jgi:hypothetical protein
VTEQLGQAQLVQAQQPSVVEQTVELWAYQDHQ